MPSFNDVNLSSLIAFGTGCKYTTAALSGSTAAVGDLTGAAVCVMNNSGANPGTYTPRTAAQMIADAGLQVNQGWLILLCNGQGTGVLTLATNATGVTVTGTNTVAINTGRIFVATVTGPAAITFQNVGSFTAP